MISADWRVSSMNAISSIPLQLILILVAIVVLTARPTFDRKRIRKNIEAHGGKVVEIVGRSSWGTRNSRIYEVSYTTAGGERMEATCETSMSGVYWIGQRPPGL